MLSYISEKENILSITLDNEKILSTDILERKVLESNFKLHIFCQSLNEIERKKIINDLQLLTEWIEKQDKLGIYPVLSNNLTVINMESNSPKLIKRVENGNAFYELNLTLNYIKEN